MTFCLPKFVTLSLYVFVGIISLGTLLDKLWALKN